jgi:hypothetical protein
MPDHPTPVPGAGQELSLDDHAREINRHHAQAETAARTSIEHAVRAGEHLIAVKAEIVHGQWRPWLQANCKFSERTAQAYMRLARELPRFKSAAAADLGTLRLALALVAEPHTPAGYSTQTVMVTLGPDKPLVATPVSVSYREETKEIFAHVPPYEPERERVALRAVPALPESRDERYLDTLEQAIEYGREFEQALIEAADAKGSAGEQVEGLVLEAKNVAEVAWLFGDLDDDDAPSAD